MWKRPASSRGVAGQKVHATVLTDVLDQLGEAQAGAQEIELASFTQERRVRAIARESLLRRGADCRSISSRPLRARDELVHQQRC